jgi:iron-only hydrogenase group A
MQIKINGRPCEAQAGETIHEVAGRAGVRIPTLCHIQGMLPSGACRICVVEVEGQRGLVPSCSYPAQEGMAVQTHSPKAVEARRTIVELLLANHPDDCLYCVRSGDCSLQDLAELHGVRQRRYPGARRVHPLDVSSPALVRDPDKCILCGKCVRVCEETMGVSAIDFVRRGSATVVGPAFDEGLNLSSCVTCGQCIVVCPTGALREQSHLERTSAALKDPALTVVVQHAPAVSVSIAEEFGLPAGRDCNGLLVAALRRLGFDRVFDTAFAADLTILEEASELVRRLSQGGPLPMFTSCSPGWVKFLEQEAPELLPNLSTCKSPQQMMGAVVKSWWATKAGLDPASIYSVSVMPCTAKKFEAGRAEQLHGGHADVDAVLTVRELVRMIRQRGIDFAALEPEQADLPLGMRSTAGKLFGLSGGVMEAALRTVHWLLTGEDDPAPRTGGLRGEGDLQLRNLNIGGREIGVAVANGLPAARRLLEEIRQGRHPGLHFVEVMTCPGGCIGGGGQPFRLDEDRVRERLAALRRIDEEGMLRRSHRNWAVGELYREFLGEPLSERSHELLHTSYAPRTVAH